MAIRAAYPSRIQAERKRISQIAGALTPAATCWPRAAPTAPNFVYDGENRMVADPTAGAAYVYDGNGTRVQKCLPNCTSPSSSTVFVFSGSQDIAEYDNGAAPASPSREFVYSDGLPGSGLLATLTGGSSPTVTYFHDDHLSWRISTDGTPGSPTYGQVNGSQGSYPFGESWYSSNANEFAFTSYQRDSESGLDYAMARYYDSTAARFCSADPVGGQLDDPQTWNRYAYVRNDPVNLTDPNGESWLNWLIDGIIGALAIALPELDPVLFSFTGETTAVTTATETAVETASINGQVVSAGAQILQTVTLTSNVSTLSFAAMAGAASGGAQAGSAHAPQQPQTKPQNQKDIDKCKGKVLKAVNKKFGAKYTSNDIGTGKYAPFAWPANTPGATVNDDIFVPSAQQPTPVSPGRYPMHWWRYITGVGSTLHVPAGPGGLDSPATLVYSASQFTAHLDSAFPYNPIGLAWHGLHDVLGLGGHSPCP